MLALITFTIILTAEIACLRMIHRDYKQLGLAQQKIEMTKQIKPELENLEAQINEIKRSTRVGNK